MGFNGGIGDVLLLMAMACLGTGFTAWLLWTIVCFVGKRIEKQHEAGQCNDGSCVRYIRFSEAQRLFLAKMADKLPVLADVLDWIDVQIKDGTIKTNPPLQISGDEVQQDLRRLANMLECVSRKMQEDDVNENNA